MKLPNQSDNLLVECEVGTTGNFHFLEPNPTEKKTEQ